MDCNLVFDEESLKMNVTKILELGIPPHFIGHEEKAIKKLLLKKKNTYYNLLHGIMLRFDDLEMLETTGRIIDDNPLMYWKIRARFDVLTVSVGQLVKMKISTLGEGYIRGAIAGCISVNIEIDSELTPDEVRFCYSFKQEDDIIFRVKNFVLTEMTISGVIDKVCIEQMRLLYAFE